MAMGSEICELNNTINIETLKTNAKSFVPLYIEDIDTLIFQLPSPSPAISVDCNGDFMLRVNPKTKEVVGVEIEDFEGYFITKYPQFATIWKEIKRTVKKNKCENEEVNVFLSVFEELMNSLISKQDCIKLTVPSSQSSLFGTA
jgi:hypothetical protein